MNWIKRKRNRVIVAYPLAVWTYGLIFATISDVYPSTIVELLQFAFLPVLLTLQIPFLFMKGSGWLFVIVAGLLWTGFYYALKKIAGRTY
ncbi:MAG: hypothetical protein ACM3MB_09230 [Acidobacteriota bacterium]